MGHNIDVLEVSPTKRNIEFVYSEGKLTKTSELASKAGALAAVNGG